jgi:hypothetical protein
MLLALLDATKSLELAFIIALRVFNTLFCEQASIASKISSFSTTEIKNNRMVENMAQSSHTINCLSSDYNRNNSSGQCSSVHQVYFLCELSIAQMACVRKSR